MGFRRLLFVPTLLAAASTPYFVLDDQWQPRLKQQLYGLVGGSAPATADGEGPSEVVAPDPLPGLSVEVAGERVQDFRELFRFNATPDWVTRRWGRVTTVLGEADLLGMRVPVVTGTELDDLAGSLTYYFDKTHQIQRITFHGSTGDPERLIRTTTTYYHLHREPSLGAGVFLNRWNGRITSAMRVEHSPIVRVNQPHSRFRVELEINRSALEYGLSPEFEQILNAERGLRIAE